jgi:5,10-methylene-tetrahydrofolate dehydrogenase/methenyl tetrahydrofolate cyclohydrolase
VRILGTVGEKSGNPKGIGLGAEVVPISPDISADEFNLIIKNLNDNEGVGGIIVQKPLPKQLEKLEENIIPEKDLDALSGSNNRKFEYPATSEAIVRIVDNFAQPGKKVAL